MSRQILPALGFLVALICSALAGTPARAGDSSIHPQPEPFFERNQGQASSEALYLTYGPTYSGMLERDNVTLILNAPVSSQVSVQHSSVLRLRFPGASKQTLVEGLEPQPGISNYFSGSDPAKWHTHIPHFARVAYRQIYPGIDLLFYFRGGELEYDIQVQPGVDARAFRIGIEGGDAVLDSRGDVVISSARTELLKIKKPRVFQQEGNTRSIAASYVLDDHELAIQLGHYDRSHQLTIDPALAFSTFLGSNCVIDPVTTPGCNGAIFDLAVDDTGIYLVGFTEASIFPNQPGQPMATKGGDQTVVVKLDPTGSKVLYSAFLSCSLGYSIAVDSKGAAYIFGDVAFTFCSTFPLTPGSFSSKPPKVSHLVPYVAKLSSDGATLSYSTLLMQDSGNPQLTFQEEMVPTKIAVDSSGAAYVGGTVGTVDLLSSLAPVPTTVGAFQTVRPGSPSLIVMKLNPTGSALEYSTYTGTVAVNEGGFAVDSSGSAYIAGAAGAGYPTTKGAYQEQNITGGMNAVLSKLSPDGSSLVYSTYFGSPGVVQSSGVAVSSTGEAVLVGYGEDPPTTPGAVCTVFNPNAQTAFVSRFNTTGSALVYSTTLCDGVGLNEKAKAVAVDAQGAAYVVSWVAASAGSPFPLLQPIQNYLFGDPDQTYGVLKLDSSGALQWSTFLGNQANSETMQHIAVDSFGSVYMLNPFFTTPGAFEPVPPNSGTYLAKILPVLGAPVPVLIPRAINFGIQVVGSSSNPVNVVVGNFGDATLAQPTVSITGDFSQTNSCTASVPGGQKCDINVTFTPVVNGTRTGTVTVKFGGGLADQTLVLTGTGISPVVTPSSTSLTFPPQALGTTSKALSVTISNTGTAPLHVSLVQATGDFGQTNTCGAPVAAGSNCVVQVTFAPTVSGTRKGSLILTDDALDSPQTIPLSGFGGQAAMVSLSTSALNFSVQQNVGSASPGLPVILTNIGNVSLNIGHITTAGDFTQTNNCVTVTAGGNCTILVNFTPTAAGQRNGTLTITDDSITSPESVTLSGMGADFIFPPPPGPTTATISAGQTATYMLAVNSIGGSSERVSFSCSGAPSLSTCAIAPPSTTVDSSAQNFAVIITTTAAGGMVHVPQTPDWPFGLWAAVLGILTFMLRKHRQVRWGVIASVGVVVLWIGCGGGGGSGGGGGQPGTPSGTYTVVVTATATSGGGSLSHSINLTLVVK